MLVKYHTRVHKHRFHQLKCLVWISRPLSRAFLWNTNQSVSRARSAWGSTFKTPSASRMWKINDCEAKISIWKNVWVISSPKIKFLPSSTKCTRSCHKLTISNQMATVSKKRFATSLTSCLSKNCLRIWAKLKRRKRSNWYQNISSTHKVLEMFVLRKVRTQSHLSHWKVEIKRLS